MAATGVEPWFHGRITRYLAEARLESQPVGSFLFRDSETRDGYSLSMRVPDKIKHFMISEERPNVYKLVGKPSEFSTMNDLVEFYKTSPTSTTDGVCLLVPCPEQDAYDDDEQENPYVDLIEGEVNTEAMEEVQKLSRKKSEAMIQQQSLQNKKEKDKKQSGRKKHSYEHVSLGGGKK